MHKLVMGGGRIALNFGTFLLSFSFLLRPSRVRGFLSLAYFSFGHFFYVRCQKNVTVQKCQLSVVSVSVKKEKAFQKNKFMP